MPPDANGRNSAPASSRKPVRSDPPPFAFDPLRTQALDRFEKEALKTKILTIVAPVGYGKTVLMSSILAGLRRKGRHCIWYSLDDRDTSVENVVNALEALLHGSENRIHPTQALFRGQEPAESRIAALIDLLGRAASPLTVFIDNLNYCKDFNLGRLLDGLIFQTDAALQLVISSTHDMPLDVSSARLHGLLHEIGPAELSFDAEEITQLLGPQLCCRIGQDGIEEVARRTEGWPAAVRMAQIILSNTGSPAAQNIFSGSDETLAHLLNRQVLSSFDAEVREFLFSIAPLRTFNAELCRHITGCRRAREHLTYLLDRNIFLIPMDRNRRWYRLHGLFREHLLHEAENAFSEERRRDILIRAAQWCEKNGHWRESAEYALASGSAVTASRILDHIAPMVVRNRGDDLQFIQWIEALHNMDHQAGPEAEYWFAWALAFRRRYDYARRQSADLALRVQRRWPKAEAQKMKDIQRRIAILRAAIDNLSDHIQDAHAGASKWLSGGSESDDPFDLTAAHCIESCYFSSMFRFVEARRAIQAARETAYQSGSANVAAWVSTYAGLASIYAGEYATAHQELSAALTAARAALGDDTGICGTMSIVAAKAAVEMGLDDDAWKLLNFGIKTSRTHGFLEAAACGMEAAIKLWNGSKDDGVSLSFLRNVADTYPPRLSLMLSCYLIQRLTVLNRVDEAFDEAGRIGLGSNNPVSLNLRLPEASNNAQVDALIEDTRITLLVASGKFKLAEATMAEATHHTKAARCVSRLVELAMASATIALRTGQQSLAVRHITRAISVAATHGIVRPFKDHAETLATVVADTKVSTWGFATDNERKFFVDRCRQLTFGDQLLYDRIAALYDEAPHLSAKLTSREHELLHYIEAGLSNQQIADRIDVSLTTVKWHLQNLYAKLGVTTRSSALARARVLNLLAR